MNSDTSKLNKLAKLLLADPSVLSPVNGKFAIIQGVNASQIEGLLHREIRNGNYLNLSDSSLVGLANLFPATIGKTISIKKPELITTESEEALVEKLGVKDKKSYASYKGMKEPKEFGDYLERMHKRIYDRKSKKIKPLVDPKKSSIPGVSSYLKRG